MSEVVALLSVIATVELYQLGVMAFFVGLLVVTIITRHWVVR